MRFYVKSAVAVLVWGVGLCIAGAQQPVQQPRAPAKPGRKIDRTLTQDERLSIIAAALDSKVRRDSGHDCSHLVHAIYERAGFPYVYASSDDLYDGVEGFRRVTQPQPGDIIVWPGHAGIVVRPSHHVFFSFLTAGPGIDDYHSRYWIERGDPRFYRYVKGDACTSCTSASRVRPTR
jgi:cell wall-associated NlpC family hydrolase